MRTRRLIALATLTFTIGSTAFAEGSVQSDLKAPVMASASTSLAVVEVNAVRDTYHWQWIYNQEQKPTYSIAGFEIEDTGLDLSDDPAANTAISPIVMLTLAVPVTGHPELFCMILDRFAVKAMPHWR